MCSKCNKIGDHKEEHEVKATVWTLAMLKAQEYAYERILKNIRSKIEELKAEIDELKKK